MSGQVVHLEPDPHVAVQKLLPWYVTGRLEAAERAAVDAHLAACADCRGELETERQWQLLQPGHGAPADVEQGWARMRDRLDADAAPRFPVFADAADRDDHREASDGRCGARAPWQLGGRPIPRAWAAPALLSVALVVALGFTLRPAPGGGAGYRALSAPAADSGTAVVRFRADATEAQIRHGLAASGARLVDGPTVTDAYVVRLPRERYAASLAALRRAPGVTLVEALETAPPP